MKSAIEQSNFRVHSHEDRLPILTPLSFHLYLDIICLFDHFTSGV